jgi:hypothetical protein
MTSVGNRPRQCLFAAMPAFSQIRPDIAALAECVDLPRPLRRRINRRRVGRRQLQNRARCGTGFRLQQGFGIQADPEERHAQGSRVDRETQMRRGHEARMLEPQFEELRVSQPLRFDTRAQHGAHRQHHAAKQVPVDPHAQQLATQQGAVDAGRDFHIEDQRPPIRRARHPQNAGRTHRPQPVGFRGAPAVQPEGCAVSRAVEVYLDRDAAVSDWCVFHLPPA